MVACVGEELGAMEGDDGDALGLELGARVVGDVEGDALGLVLGLLDGIDEGLDVGARVEQRPSMLPGAAHDPLAPTHTLVPAHSLWAQHPRPVVHGTQMPPQSWYRLRGAMWNQSNEYP